MRRARAGHGTWRGIARGLLTVVLVGIGAGCGDEPASREVELPIEVPDGTVLPPGTAQVAHSRPDSIMSVWVEGDSLQPVVFHLYRSPHRFPVSFSTYLPAGVRALATGDNVRFVLGEGAGDTAPLLEVIVFPEGLSERDARMRARGLLSALGRTEEGGAHSGLVAVFFVNEETGAVARVDLARDGERWVALRARSPRGSIEEEPRLQHLRATFVWDATGEPLLGQPQVQDTTGSSISPEPAAPSPEGH